MIFNKSLIITSIHNFYFIDGRLPNKNLLYLISVFNIQYPIKIFLKVNLHVTRYTLHVTRYTLHVTRYTLHVTCYMLHVTRYTLHVTRYTLHAF